MGDPNTQNPAPVRPPVVSQNKTRIPKPMKCSVLLLDGQVYTVDVDKNARGQTLYELVCDYIDLLERDYFGLRFKEELHPENIKYWIDPEKKLSKQKKHGKMEFEFALKFYPPDPTQLAESFTRNLVSLQIRRDIISGKLPCSLATYGMLGSYAVQTDLGDYDPLDHGTGIRYISKMPFAPEQDEEMLYKIAELHKQHKGQTPEDAELHYLEYAKKIALYGIDLHRARDSDMVDILIGVGATGISVFRDNLRINRFVWPKILKISYRKNKFLLRIRPAEFDAYESWIAFKLPNNKMAKRLWKIAVEHHSFLRLKTAGDARKRTGFPRFGSKYRYSGRTLHETRLNASMADRPAKQFDRAQSNRSLNTILNNNRTRSQDNLNYRQPYRNQLASEHNFERPRNQPTRQPDYFELEPNYNESPQDRPSANYDGSPRNRAPVSHDDAPRSRAPVIPIEKFEDGRTPLQSPAPKEQPPQFPTQRIRDYDKDDNSDTTSLEDRLPSVPQDSPQESRKSRLETFGGVDTPIAALANVMKQREEEVERNGRAGSWRGSRNSLDLIEQNDNGKPAVAPKPGKPPVAKKPDKPSKSKPNKKEKKAEREPIREIDL